MKYIFDKKLIEAVIVKRKSQFTMIIDINGVETICHCPTTGRIGNLEMKNIACLLSKNENPKRKTKYTVEAISTDNLDILNKHWIGINQILSNKLVKFFFETHQLDKIISNYTKINREIMLGNSKIDFLIKTTYLEVKTPLNTLHVKYGDKVNIRPTTPFSSVDRFVKHVTELAELLQNHKKAILLVMYQYEITQRKMYPKSTRSKEIYEIVKTAIEKGVQFYEITTKFMPNGVKLKTVKNITSEIYSFIL